MKFFWDISLDDGDWRALLNRQFAAASTYLRDHTAHAGKLAWGLGMLVFCVVAIGVLAATRRRKKTNAAQQTAMAARDRDVTAQDVTAQDVTAGAARMAAQLSHDIRSPLTALQIVAQHAPELAEEKRLLLRDAIERIGDIANNLVTQHPAPNARQGREPRHTLIIPQLQSTLSERRLFADSAAVRLVLALEPSTEPNTESAFVEVAPSDLRRVVAALIDNAVQASPPQSHVVLQVRSDAQWIYVQICDTGCGMAAQDIPHLLQAGQGLSDAHAAIRSWGGTLSIQSALGKGTTLTFQLPRAAVPLNSI